MNVELNAIGCTKLVNIENDINIYKERWLDEDMKKEMSELTETKYVIPHTAVFKFEGAYNKQGLRIFTLAKIE